MNQIKLIILMIVIPQFLSKELRGKNCVCDLKNTDPAFPENKLRRIVTDVSQCTMTNTSEKKEDERNVYGAVSLCIVDLELVEIQDLLDKLNKTTRNFQQLSIVTKTQLSNMKDTMVELEKFDNMQVVKKERENQLIKRDLEQSQKDLKPTPPTQQFLRKRLCFFFMTVPSTCDPPISYSTKTVTGQEREQGLMGQFQVSSSEVKARGSKRRVQKY
ncbi:hypothetical protein E1301_Tti003806 [Triplophysa tibetana]|uniref:Uncharacterized protein n=1 Tax=Triplophysa tibetana TaxID=1572043 RepID=A0A5A9PRV3_9TELE|nr:hypothetical protein E1301_Tti003806 [Triplophysa tibetana]